MTVTAAKERPILFSAEMVRAILADRKRQTRRIVKPQPEGSPHSVAFGSALPPFDKEFGAWFQYRERYGVISTSQRIEDSNCSVFHRCPYGGPGDRLWVRETWQQSMLIRKGGGERQTVRNPAKGLGDIHYGADHYAGFDGDEPPTWRPSIHMPRWASRLTLEIESVRVERVQDISESDCWAEGIEELDGSLDDAEICAMAKQLGQSFEDARPTFALLWNKVNGPGAWERNDFVWAITFKRLEQP